MSKELKYREAEQTLQATLENFLGEIGVSIETVTSIVDDEGNVINAVGAADLTNRIVKVVNGTADISTLTEESVHFLVEILRAQESPLYTSMYNLIERHQEFKDMMSKDSFYFEKYNGDIDLILSLIHI